MTKPLLATLALLTGCQFVTTTRTATPAAAEPSSASTEEPSSGGRRPRLDESQMNAMIGRPVDEVKQALVAYGFRGAFEVHTTTQCAPGIVCEIGGVHEYHSWWLVPTPDERPVALTIGK